MPDGLSERGRAPAADRDHEIDAPHRHATELGLDERPVILERPGATCEGGAGG